MSGVLPPGFEALEPFVARWVLPDAAARMARRQECGIAELRAFYAAMLPLGEAALAHLREHRLGELAAPEENLLKLMLALAEVAPAVEWYNDPRVFDGFPVERISYLRQISDTGAQA